MRAEKKSDVVLPLKGAVNFRDMGGLQTSDGKYVKKGILFRAAELTGLTDEDINLLEKMNIKTIFDYRRDAEAVRKPDPPIKNAINERVPVMIDNNIAANMNAKDEEINRAFYERYTKEGFLNLYKTIPIQNPSYKRLMQLVKTPEKNLPLVHHCTGGRDRTGVGAMIILMTIGVPFETVLDDYLLSNKMLETFHNKVFEKAARFFNEEEMKQFKEGFLLQEEYLQTAYYSIIDTYRDFDVYLLEEFNIDEEARNQIRRFCLV